SEEIFPAISASERNGLVAGKSNDKPVLFFTFATQRVWLFRALASGKGVVGVVVPQLVTDTATKIRLNSAAPILVETRLHPYARKTSPHPRVTSVGPNGRSNRIER